MNVSFNPQRIRSGARASVTPALKCAASILLLTLSIQAGSAQAELSPVQKETEAARVSLAKLSQAQRTELEAMLKTEIQRVVNKQKRVEGQTKNITVRGVRFKPRTGTEGLLLVIDLSKGYVPRHFGGGEMEDLLHEISSTAHDLLLDVIPLGGTEILYDGKDIYHYFPEELHNLPPKKNSTAVPAAEAAALATEAKVVVDAGHGAYFNYEYNDWRPHIDPVNGITEDYVTPGYASELKTWLNARSATATISLPRSTATTTHAPSGKPWWQLGARYHLQVLYPQNPEIWHSRPTDTSGMRENNEDINSRPKFANHIGANTLIHLHTNGGVPTASGAQVWYHTGRIADQALGNSVLCYMKELIQAKASYKNYIVETTARDGTNKGENALATMPSIIVEAGFHSNASDALALQDPVFRTAAMKGVEKGYRLNAAGKTTCEPFKISSIPNVSGPRGTSIQVKHYYTGYPQYPVTRKSEVVSTPSGWNYIGGEKIFNAGSSPLLSTATCGQHSTAGTVRMRVTLTDADGVKTEPVEYSFTCT